MSLFLFIPQIGFGYDNSTLQRMIQESKTRADIVESTQKAVVHITIEKRVKAGMGSQFPDNPFDHFDDEFFDRFFPNMRPKRYQPDRPQEFKQQGAGSGAIIDKDGHILTNNHVVGNSDKIIVKLIDGREYKAKVIGTDPLTDIAVIKIDADNLDVLPLGDSDEIRIGETVIAIGNPFGLSHTVTMGIVSAKGRSNVNITDYEDFIQTDAAINPGNSGGPLINLEGKMIGVNTAIFTRSGGYQGVGFSVPINMAKQVMNQLIENGEVSRGWMGIFLQNITNDLMEAMELKSSDGALVAEVTEGSPAEEGGLKRGDVIVKFKDKAIRNADHLKNEVGMSNPDSKVKIEVIRKGKREILTIKLGSRPTKEFAMSGLPGFENPLGIKVQTLTPGLARQYGYDRYDAGVIITHIAPNSQAQNAGLRIGDLILEINSKPVNNMIDFEEEIKKVDIKKGIMLLIGTKTGARYIIVKNSD